MKRNNPPIWLCVFVLVISLLWRMGGAPVTMEQFQGMGTAFTQARILLPARAVRIWHFWIGNAEAKQAVTMVDETETEEQTSEEKQTISVYVTQEKRMEKMTLEGYVCGVVAAEMPVQYHMEALKAQAVAARTRALSQMEAGGCSLHAGADICTDSAHCQGYATLGECRERWKDEYEPYRNRILEAQRATRGQVLTYDGELITVLYHAISGGMTEDVQNVFSESIPYLVSVESGGEEGAKGFWQDLSISYDEIARKANAVFPGLNAEAETIQRTFSITGYTPSGRVESVQIAGHEISAPVFRRMLGLRSTWFSVSSDANGITFHQRGYGHGVGMSQAGANAMAAGGAAYDSILQHYYPGVLLETNEARLLRTGYPGRDQHAAEWQNQGSSAPSVSPV